jgi:hypothetical protein
MDGNENEWTWNENININQNINQNKNININQINTKPTWSTERKVALVVFVSTLGVALVLTLLLVGIFDQPPVVTPLCPPGSKSDGKCISADSLSVSKIINNSNDNNNNINDNNTNDNIITNTKLYFTGPNKIPTSTKIAKNNFTSVRFNSI